LPLRMSFHSGLRAPEGRHRGRRQKDLVSPLQSSAFRSFSSTGLRPGLFPAGASRLNITFSESFEGK
jgi:hypothetical protein